MTCPYYNEDYPKCNKEPMLSTPLEQFNEEVIRELGKNLPPDLMGKYVMDFVINKLVAHKELILKMVRERVPEKANERNMARMPKNITLDTVGAVEAWNECRQEFLNNLDTL